MKMLSLELEDILDNNMDKAGKANVSTIVGDFKIMDMVDVADVSAIVGVKDICPKLPINEPYKRTLGVPDQGQTLDV
jgi:hypothetical protein